MNRNIVLFFVSGFLCAHAPLVVCGEVGGYGVGLRISSSSVPGSEEPRREDLEEIAMHSGEASTSAALSHYEYYSEDDLRNMFGAAVDAERAGDWEKTQSLYHEIVVHSAPKSFENTLAREQLERIYSYNSRNGAGSASALIIEPVVDTSALFVMDNNAHNTEG